MQLPYRAVEVNPLTKRELKWSEYKKVPVMLVDGEVVADSSAIISRLDAGLAARTFAAEPPAKRSWFSSALAVRWKLLESCNRSPIQVCHMLKHTGAWTLPLV